MCWLKTTAAIVLAAIAAVNACAQSAGQAAKSPLAEFIFPEMPNLELPPGVEVLFGPRDDIQGRVIKAISSAQHEIIISAYILTSANVIDAIDAAFQRKVMVMLLLDANPAVRGYQTFDELKRRGIPVIPIKRDPSRWSNAKYIIVDRSYVLTGTFDLTVAATRNDEILMAFYEPSFVTTFYNRFRETVMPMAAANRQRVKGE